MPDGEATVLQAKSPLVRVIEGKVLSYVEVHTAWGIHTVSLMGSPGKYLFPHSQMVAFNHGPFIDRLVICDLMFRT